MNANRSLENPILFSIDVYSRMIFGYYLSFDHGSYLSIGMCLLMGITPKDNLLKQFNISEMLGQYKELPRRFLVDNGKDFRGKGFDLIL